MVFNISYVINEIVTGIYNINLIELVIIVIIVSFVVAKFHTMSKHERIVIDAKGEKEYKEYIINNCSAHITNKLFISTGSEGGGIGIHFSPRPVIEALFGSYKSEFGL